MIKDKAIDINWSDARIEDEYDLKIYKQAYAEYKADPETISHADFKKELGL